MNGIRVSVLFVFCLFAMRPHCIASDFSAKMYAESEVPSERRESISGITYPEHPTTGYVFICTGTGTVISNNGVPDPNDATGLPDNNFAELYQAGDEIILDLGEALSATTTINITYQRVSSSVPILDIRVSANAGSGFSAVAESPYTISTGQGVTASFTVTVPAGNQYLQIESNNGIDAGIDGIDFTCPPPACSPTNATATANQATCNGTPPAATANSDASVVLNTVTNGDRYHIVSDGDFTGMNAANATMLPGNAPYTLLSGLVNPPSDVTYTIRVFNGNDDACVTEVTTILASVDCNFVPGCNCTDYLYLNDVDVNEVHKFSVATDGSVTEIGSPWFPTNPGDAINSPHGLAMDLNGFLYIGEVVQFPGSATGGIEGPVYKLTCDGTILETDVLAPNPYFYANYGSHNGILYVPFEGTDAIRAFSLCDGTEIGSMSIGKPDDVKGWGFYTDDTYWYYPDREFGNVYRGLLDPTLYNAGVTNSGSLLFSTGIATSNNFTHAQLSGLMGLTRDAAGNFFIVQNNAAGSFGTVNIHKYSPTGTWLNTITDSDNSTNTIDGQPGFWGARGIVYSPMSGLLYVGNYANCITVFDTNLVEQTPLNIGNPLNGSPKGVGILAECCPVSTSTVINESICFTGSTEKVFLQELINCQEDGIICEGQWTETSNSSGGNIGFNTCDLSVTVRGTGCAVYNLTKGAQTGNQQCGAFNITVNVCSAIPAAVTVGSTSGSCNGSTPNDDATINLTNVTGTEANASIGSAYTGPDFGDASNIDVSSGTGTLTGLMHATQYTVRVWNQGNGCFTDETITTPNITCASGCSCEEYIYLNEAGGGRVHKYQINPTDGSLSEILTGAGNTWYPGDAASSELPDPHGLGTDLNGFLYIATGFGTFTSDIRRLKCDGTIAPETVFNIDAGAYNIAGVENTLYVSGIYPELRVFDICSQTQYQDIDLTGDNYPNTTNERWTWGLFVDNETIYVTKKQLGVVSADDTENEPNLLYRFPAPSVNELLAGGISVSPFLTETSNTITYSPALNEMALPRGQLTGVTTDNVGNIYIVHNIDGRLSVDGSVGNGFRLIKYNQNGEYLGASAYDTADNNSDGNSYHRTIGVVYSSTSDKLYTSSTSKVEDCVTIFNTDLTVHASGVGPTTDPNANAKGISIAKECCPNVPSMTYDEVICSEGNGERLFLQELFSCGDGIVCEGQWTESSNTSNGAIQYNSCDLSITVNGSGCATYQLEKTDPATTLAPCQPFMITVNVCTEIPTANITSNQGTCTGDTPNDDATINLATVTGDEANFSIGASYSGPDYGSGGTDISSGSAAITGLMHNTQYTVRIFNGSNDCFSDETITTPNITCTATTYSLGNRVFFDSDNNGINDPTESGVAGVQLQLLNADGSVYDSNPGTPAIDALTVTTGSTGYYRFDNLPAGSYIVEILSTAFDSGQVLNNYVSSDGSGEEADPNADGDLNDNGIDPGSAGAAVRSGIVTLGGTEPTGEQEPLNYEAGSFTGTASPDTENNLTVDFGFYAQRDLPDFNNPGQPACTEDPCHFVNNDIYLGTGVTSDSGSQGSSTADTDIDDGILINERVQIVPGAALSLPVLMYNNTGSDAYLRGWIDWNGDGDFDDAGEQVADLLYLGMVYTGSFTDYVTVNIPADAAKETDLATRWRISTDDTNTNSPCGNGSCAADGEIEDYLLRVSCPTALCPVGSVTLIRN